MLQDDMGALPVKHIIVMRDGRMGRMDSTLSPPDISSHFDVCPGIVTYPRVFQTRKSTTPLQWCSPSGLQEILRDRFEQGTSDRRGYGPRSTRVPFHQPYSTCSSSIPNLSTPRKQADMTYSSYLGCGAHSSSRRELGHVAMREINLKVRENSPSMINRISCSPTRRNKKPPF